MNKIALLKITAILFIAVGFFFGAKIDSMLADLGINVFIKLYEFVIIPNIWSFAIGLNVTCIMIVLGVLILLFT